MDITETSQSALLPYMELFDTIRFKWWLYSPELPAMYFLRWVKKVKLPTAKRTLSKNEEKVPRRKSKLKERHFLPSDNPALQEFGTEKICQHLRAFLAILTDVLKAGGA